jgi:hypothetical protein
LIKSGPYASEIKGTLVEQPHSVIGSSAFIQQYPETIAIEAGIRIGKDVDVLIERPSKALESLTAKTGLTTEDASKILDVHPIPERYPLLKPSSEKEVSIGDVSSLSTKLFGDPFRKMAFPRGTSEIITPGQYEGSLTYEAAQVQLGRKAAGVAQLIESPITKGYRGQKDIYDFLTAYRAQRAVGISKGIPESSFSSSDIAFKTFIEREFTVGTVKGQKVTSEGMQTFKVSNVYEAMRKENAGILKQYFGGVKFEGIPTKADRYESYGMGYIGSSIEKSYIPISSALPSVVSYETSIIPSEISAASDITIPSISQSASSITSRLSQVGSLVSTTDIITKSAIESRASSELSSLASLPSTKSAITSDLSVYEGGNSAISAPISQPATPSEIISAMPSSTQYVLPSEIYSPAILPSAIPPLALPSVLKTTLPYKYIPPVTTPTLLPPGDTVYSDFISPRPVPGLPGSTSSDEYGIVKARIYSRKIQREILYIGPNVYRVPKPIGMSKHATKHVTKKKK